MPPKVRITKEMMVNAGIALVREKGPEGLSVRNIASQLGCSTQPIMYQYASMDELRQEIYETVDAAHSQYLMQLDPNCENPLLEIGMRYIRYSVQERNLFRFLFQSDRFPSPSLQSMMDSEGLRPIFDAFQTVAGLTEEQSKQAFAALFISAHGIASMLANNSLQYEEEFFSGILMNVFYGVIGVMVGQSNAETVS